MDTFVTGLHPCEEVAADSAPTSVSIIVACECLARLFGIYVKDIFCNKFDHFMKEIKTLIIPNLLHFPVKNQTARQ